MKRIFAVLAAMIASGCASTSTMGLARTLNRGAVQGWVAAEGGANVPVTANPSSTTTAAVGYPNLEGGVRFGASDNVELGAKLGFNGFGLEGKFALVRPETMESGLNVSIAPQASFLGLAVPGATIGNFTAQLPVLFGFDFAGHELVLGPRLHNQLVFGAVSTGNQIESVNLNLLSAGMTVGFAIKVGSSVRIVPEIALLVPFFAAVGANTQGTSSVVAGAGVGGFSLQAGVGFLFGSRDAYERPTPREFTPPTPQPMPYPVQPLPADAPPTPPATGESTGEVQPLPPPPPLPQP
ncbi:MAG: hypothetical protein ACO1OB_23140 [Archangium sp.]